MSENLSLLTDSLMDQPLLDFNAETLFSNLLGEAEEIILEDEDTPSLICEEVRLICEEELILEEEMNSKKEQEAARRLEVLLEQREVIQVLTKRRKRKPTLNRVQFTKEDIPTKASPLTASRKSHQEVVNMISKVYQALPKNFTLHSSFSKITKIQKLDQIHKFVLNAQQNGYVANK